jgi:hypothetical protein
MKIKFIMTFMLVVLCAAAGAAGQDQAKTQSPGFAEWLKGLQQRIAQIVPKRTVPMSTGVAGVRGAKEDGHIKLYWKGKQGQDAVTEEEMGKFKACVDLAATGDRDSSLKQLEEFMKQYPDSALIPDAKKALDMVRAEPQPEEKVEQKAEEKTAEIKQDVKKDENKEGQKSDK